MIERTQALKRIATARGLLGLALPLAAGMGVGFLLHFINRLMLGWYSPEALAASHPAGMVAWTFQGFFVVSAGFVGTFAAQHHGAGEDDEAGAMLWPALWLGLMATVVTVALIPARHLLTIPFGIKDPVVAAGMSELLGWYLAETGPIVLMSALSGFIGGLGRTRLVFWLSAAACLVSIALNRWLIFGGFGVPALGISGAGLATLGTSLLFMTIWASLVLRGPVAARFGTWRQRHAERTRLLRFARFSLPRGATEILEMVAFLVFSAAITRLSTAELNASNIAFQIYLLVLVPFIGFGQGLAIAIGQCLGAGRADLAWRTSRVAIALVLPILALIAAAFALLPGQLMGIYSFAGPGADAATQARWDAVVTAGIPVMQVLALGIVGDGLHWVFRMTLVGAGDTRWPLVAMVSAAIVTLSIPVWLLLTLVSPSTLAAWHLTVLSASYAIFVVYTWTISLVLFLRYRYGPWPRMSVRG